MLISQKAVNKFITLIFLLLTFQITIFHYIDEGVFPRLLLYLFYFATLLLFIVSYNSVKIKWSVYRMMYLFFFGIVLLTTIAQPQGDTGEMVANFCIYLSILTAFWFSNIKLELILKALKVVAIFGVIAFIYIITISDIDLEAALRRGYTWTEIFYYGPIFWSVIPFVILAFLYEKHITLALIFWGCAVVLNLLFLKRAILVDSLLLILTIVYINYHKKKKIASGLKLFVLISILIGTSLYFFSDSLMRLFDATNDRMSDSSDDISNFDRLIESKDHFASKSFLEIFVGNGFFGQHEGLGKVSNALHIGWFNFLFKGGAVLCILIIIPFFKLRILVRNFKYLPIEVKFSIVFLLINIPRLLYVNTHNLSPYMLLMFYSIFKIMDFKDKEYKVN